MGVRQGGSYVADPKTGAEERVGGTEQAQFTTKAKNPAPAETTEVSTAPAPEPAQAAADPSARRAGRAGTAAKE